MHVAAARVEQDKLIQARTTRKRHERREVGSLACGVPPRQSSRPSTLSRVSASVRANFGLRAWAAIDSVSGSGRV